MGGINLPPELLRDQRSADLTASEVEVRTLPPPDEAAKLRLVAQKTAQPYGAVLRQPKESQPYDLSWGKYADNPAMVQLLTDPKTAVLAQDHLPELAEALGVRENSLPTTDVGVGMEALKKNRLSAKQAFGLASDEDLAEKARLLEREKLTTSLLPKTFWEQVGTGALQNLPQLWEMLGATVAGAVAGGAAGIVGGPKGIALGGTIGGRMGALAYGLDVAIGQTFEALHDDAKIPADVAGPLAIIGGGAIGAVDAISFGAITKWTGAGKLLQKFAGVSKEAFVKGMQAAVKNPRFVELTKVLGKSMLTGGSTEILQEWLEIATVHVGAWRAPPGDYKLPTFREGVERSKVVGTVGALLEGGMGAAGRVAVDVATQADRGIQSQATVDRVYEATDPKKLKLRDRAPEVLHEAVAKSSEQPGAIKTVSLPVEKLDALFQTAGKDEAWVSSTAPAVAKAMTDARLTGGVVTVSFADFVTHIRPLDEAKTLRQDVGLNQGMSPSEAKAFAKDVEAARQAWKVDRSAYAAAVEGGEAEVGADLKAKLIAAGSSPEAAQHRSQLVARAIGMLAAKVKLDPWEVYRDAPLDVVRQGKTGTSLADAVTLFQTLSKARVEDVQVTEAKQGVTRLTFPGTPLYLDLTTDEVEGQKVLTGHLGPSGAGREAAVAFGGQGVSTMLYLKALDIAKSQGLGFASDERYAQFPVTKKMYRRLPELGVAFRESQHPDPEWRRDFVTPADLAAYESSKALEAAQLRATAFAESLTSDEVEAAMGPLALLSQQIKDDVRGFIQFNPATRNYFRITLTDKQNLSTFLHEGGHYILELYRKYEGASADIAADLRAIEKWAGVEEGKAWTDPALEKFARGFETYLMEGRAPSSALALAFANFKSWLLHVYRALKNLDAPLTDEVRSVFDRMLATEEEIQTRRIETGLFPSMAMEELMAPKDRDAYRSGYAQGAALVQQSLDREAIAALRVEKTAEFKSLKESVAAQVAAEPVYQLRRFFAGESIADVDPNLVGKKLDAQAVQDLKLGRAVMNRLQPYLTMIGGIDPDLLVPYFRYENAPAMLEALATAPNEKAENQQRVKAEMQVKYPDYGMRADWLEHTAMTRLAEDGAISNTIELELRVLHKKAGLSPPVSPAKVARMAAEANILETKRNEIYVPAYRAAETRALREQMRALAAKDFVAAADWTRKRIMAREMWLAAEKAIKASDAALKYAERFTDIGRQGRLGLSGPLGPTFRDAAKALVERLGLAEPSTEKGFAAYVKALDDAGQPVVIAPYLTEMAATRWEDLTYAAILDVKDALKNISHLAAEATKLKVGQAEMHMEAVAGRLREELQASGLHDRLAEAQDKPRSRARWLRVEIEKIETTLRDMAGGTVGFAHKVLFRSAESGQFDLDIRRAQRIKDIRAINKKHRPEGWARLANKQVQFVDGLMYTHEQLLAVINNLGTEVNTFKLLAGQEARGRTGWKYDAVIARLHEIFPESNGEKNVWAWSQAMLNYINEQKTWEEQTKVAEQISGVAPRKQRATPIPLPEGGTMQGGYYPLVRDPNAPPMKGEGADAVKQAVDAMQGTFSYRNVFVAHGFTQERTGKVYPLLLDTNVLTAHLYEVDHFIANAMGVIERYRVLNDPSIRDLIERSMGRERYQNLLDWNAHIAREGEANTRSKLQLDGIVNRLLWGNAIVVMGGNLLSGINQVVTGLPATITQLGPGGLGAFSRAFIEFVLHPFDSWESASKESGELRAATFYYDRDLRLIVEAGMKGTSWQEYRSRLANISMTPVVFGQKMVNVITYMAARQIAERKGLSPEDAVAYANSEVRQSQSSAGPKDMTAVQRSHNSLARILSALASYTFSLNDMVMPRSLTKKQLTSAVSRVLILTMTGMVAKAMFDVLFPELEKEDAKRRKGLAKKLEKLDDTQIAFRMFEAWVDGPVANIPLVGRTTASMAFGRQPKFGTSGVEHFIKVLEATSEQRFGKAEVKEIVDSIGIVTGTPTRHLLFAPGEFMWEVINGNVDENPWTTFQEATLVRPGQKGKVQ